MRLNQNEQIGLLIQKIEKNRKGIKFTEEHRKKLSESHKKLS